MRCKDSTTKTLILTCAPGLAILGTHPGGIVLQCAGLQGALAVLFANGGAGLSRAPHVLRQANDVLRGCDHSSMLTLLEGGRGSGAMPSQG